MVTIFDANPNDLIEQAAEALKKVKDIQPPAWAAYAKTGHFRQRAPLKQDWWYMRAAAVLRAVYLLGPIGTHKLRTKYGGKKDRNRGRD